MPQRARTLNIITQEVLSLFGAQCWSNNLVSAFHAELNHVLLRQGELFKADGEVVSARSHSTGQQRYLMTAEVSERGAHLGPSIAASSQVAHNELQLDGLVQQEQVLKKQVSGKRTFPYLQSNNLRMAGTTIHVRFMHTYILNLHIPCPDAQAAAPGPTHACTLERQPSTWM